MSVHILGIRHHGPGSARNVKAFLEELQPDIVLIEGPPEADALIQWAGHDDLQPPVAILAYQPDSPHKACFYPFAAFSPEWQAMLYARQQKIHARFMDLPLAHVFGIENEAEAKRMASQQAVKEGTTAGDDSDLHNGGQLAGPTLNTSRHSGEDSPSGEVFITEETDILSPSPQDPIAHLAAADGYDDGERWWEHMFEYRQQPEQVFEAVHDAMHALREELPRRYDRKEVLREAWMRKCIRQAEKEMFQRIAVICGAWHAPALQTMPKQKEDNDLLKGLPKAKVECTWIPWTYSRLSYESGYGAGIPSPGWYEHIWEHPADDGTRWMALVAKLFRQQQQDTSVAHVMEAVRLANTLASLRHYSRPGLEELNEATLSVLCMGESILMQLIRDELIIRNRIGKVPVEVPTPPLQADITRWQKKLRLPQTADFKDYTLDLRKDTDLERSIFLHRLQLLEIHWGKRYEASGKGTFKEQWRLQWDPAFSIDIIEKGSWGNTVEEATTRFVTDSANSTGTLQQVCKMLESAIPAELPAVVEVLIHRINNLAAASGDVLQLMEVIPSLVSISRYGNVRKTDAALVNDITESMISRVCISLPAACTAVADDAALPLLDLFFAMNDAISLLQHAGLTANWQETLLAISRNPHSAPMIAGYATRLLFDSKVITGNLLVKAFSVSMSVANPPAVAAAWLEGFLRGSGTLLLLDEELWNMVHNWVSQLENDIFIQVLPLLRRTFSNFTAPERKKLGDKVKHGGNGTSLKAATTGGTDYERGARGIPVVMQLLGLQDAKQLSDGA
ncbi:DUF5682 family protein [Chitinophaga arvensicola]|uniref:Uncharacterized protein n=1 Tax=Chitinophaga arvensicola TaxID=29529 RepID=A0A1I0SDW6_9BACT|nr:DUF5682 family protein [Chitinophaga arvensicola]SEW57327.1 hypothetical protein SAMN04488122_6743 [Chitinophaga arvensicola]